MRVHAYVEVDRAVFLTVHLFNGAIITGKVSLRRVKLRLVDEIFTMRKSKQKKNALVHCVLFLSRLIAIVCAGNYRM